MMQVRGARAKTAMGAVYRHELEVPNEAIDRNNHVNNVQYVQWMQDAAVLHSDAVGCTAATETIGATWVARGHRIEYLRPAFAGERIVVLTWVADFRRVRSLRKYRFVRLPGGEILAHGETDWVFVDARNGKPRAIPANVLAAFELLPESAEQQARLDPTIAALAG